MLDSFFILSLLCATSVALAVLFFFSFLFTRSKNKQMSQKLSQIEADLLQIDSVREDNLQGQEQKSLKGPKKNLLSQENLMTLRKELSKFKEDLKRAREDLRQQEKSAQEKELNTQKKLFALQEENKSLIVQLRELDQICAKFSEEHKNLVPKNMWEEKCMENESLQTELLQYKEKLLELEKQQKTNISKVISLQGKLKIAEMEISRLSKLSHEIEGETIDASNFMKWKERALMARNMYKMTRQLRDMTDQKLKTYQDGVTAVCEWILQHKGISTIPTQTNENRADRLLAEAWNTILLEKKPMFALSSPTPNTSQAAARQEATYVFPRSEYVDNEMMGSALRTVSIS